MAVLPLFLLLRLTVPIGPMYWDLFIYFDAANRIFNGQVPVVDFFVPVGPLGYYLFAGGLKLFPEAQPLLLVSWSLLVVTAPLMGMVISQISRESRGMAFAVLVPFLVFAILPFNTREYFPYPGSDGFGIYNRQCAQLLYVLVAALVFVRGQRALAFLVCAAMTALFFTKITGFLGGLVICVFAFAAGRLAFRYAAAAALAFFAILGVLQVWHGLTSSYISDILALVEMNAGELLSRYMHAGSTTFGVIAPAGILVLLLLWANRHALGERWDAFSKNRSCSNVTALLDQDAFWLGAVVFAGVFFETQNTGSQALILVWPVVLAILMRNLPLATHSPRLFAATALLAAAAVLPPFVHTIHRAARTYASALINKPLAHENLKTLGSVNARPDVVAQAKDLLDVYAEHRAAYREFVEDGSEPAFMYYLQYGFQLAHMMAIDGAINHIRALEAEKDIRFATMMEINFVNPFPYLMHRQSPKYIAIGADPTRAVPPPGSEEETAVRHTDLVLYPTCPLTTDNRDLYKLYEPALADHMKIKLGPCFDAYVNAKFATKFEGPARRRKPSDDEVPIATAQ